jgi:hypothetical protein
MKNHSLAYFALIFVGLLAGCAGTGGSVGQSHGPMLQLKFDWPDRSRLIPLACESIVVELTQGSVTVASATVARPPAGQGQTTTTFTDIPTGEMSIRATAYPEPDGSGVAQAEGNAQITIYPDVPSQASLTMGTTITNIEIQPNPVTVPIGQDVQVSMSAKDSQGRTVLVAEESIQWNVSDTSKATIIGQGTTATLHGLALGVFTVHATDMESDREGSAQATVSDVQYPTLNVPRISGAPTIDGVLGSDNGWAGASVQTIEFKRNSDGLVHNETLYLGHDGTWLYIGVQSGFASAWDVWFGLYFDGNHDQQLTGTSSQPTIDLHFATASPSSWSGYQHHWYLGPNGTVGPATPPSGTAWVGANASNVAYEYKISLANFTASPGDTIAVWMLNGVDGTGPGGYEYPRNAGVNMAARPDLWTRLVLAP